MRKIIALFVCVVLTGVCFAEKVEFLSSDKKSIGTFEFDYDDEISVVSFCETTAIHYDNAVLMQDIILLKFKNRASAKQLYDDTVVKLESFNDFAMCMQIINNIPGIKAMNPTKVVENKTIYLIKSINMD